MVNDYFVGCALMLGVMTAAAVSFVAGIFVGGVFF